MPKHQKALVFLGLVVLRRWVIDAGDATKRTLVAFGAAASSNHVIRIGLVGSGIEMLGITAVSDMAPMADDLALWHLLPVSQYPGQAMCKYRESLGFIVVADIDKAIPSLVSGAGKQPTRPTLVEFGFKPGARPRPQYRENWYCVPRHSDTLHISA